MTINKAKLLNAIKYQNRPVTMDEHFNKRIGTDFTHRAIVRKVKDLTKKEVTITDIEIWLKKQYV